MDESGLTFRLSDDGNEENQLEKGRERKESAVIHQRRKMELYAKRWKSAIILLIMELYLFWLVSLHYSRTRCICMDENTLLLCRFFVVAVARSERPHYYRTRFSVFKKWVRWNRKSNSPIPISAAMEMFFVSSGIRLDPKCDQIWHSKRISTAYN